MGGCAEKRIRCTFTERVEAIRVKHMDNRYFHHLTAAGVEVKIDI
jgi:hypothetical protein